MKEEPTKLPALDTVNPDELEAAARAAPSAVYEYFAGGAADRSRCARTARAARTTDTLLVASTLSSTPIEEIASVAGAL